MTGTGDVLITGTELETVDAGVTVAEAIGVLTFPACVSENQSKYQRLLQDLN